MSFFNGEINIPSNNGKSIQLRAPDGLGSNNSFFLPSTIGASGNILAITSFNGTDNVVGFTSDLSVNSIDASGLNANNLNLNQNNSVLSLGITNTATLTHSQIAGSSPAVYQLNIANSYDGGRPPLRITQPVSSSALSHCGLEIFVERTSLGAHQWCMYAYHAGSSDKQCDLYFSYANGDNDYGFGDKGYIDADSGSTKMNFTGQHRSIMNTNISDSYVGLIVSTTGKFVNTDNSLEVSINESLPVCVITTTDNDKKVFGVLSDKEDTNTNREYSTGSFVSVYNKQNINEQRMFINSLGEGGIWVSNKNGNIENGDYISSSNVPGYGMKQSDDLLHNYTVAKITCDCDFSTTKIVKQKLSVTTTTDPSGNTSTEIDYDANGDVQYEDDLDVNGNQQMVYPLKTRFLETDGTQITETQYTTKLANGESVYIACFVGCTYHCG